MLLVLLVGSYTWLAYKLIDRVEKLRDEFRELHARIEREKLRSTLVDDGGNVTKSKTHVWN